jgi:cation-dependent mannose-6-phosphate receptor
VYVVAGCVYKSQKLGATGVEMCPNVEFWRDLPGLVKDGCAFTIAKCKALCAGGGSASGGNTYETM